MKAEVKVNNRTIITVEGETQKDLFREMASACEVFGEKRCGLCGCEDIIPVWRTVTQLKGKKTETFEYPEYHCTKHDCRARLTLSFNMEGGTMFPNRKLLENGKPATGDDREKGKFGKHNGWTKYRGEKAEGGEAA